MKLALLDTETTGLKPKKHSMVQLAIFIVVDGVKVDEFCIKCRPIEGREIDSKALEVNGLTPAQLASYPDPKEGFEKLLEFLAKHINVEDESDRLTPAGFNINFDSGFIREFFDLMGQKDAYKNYFFRRSLDVMALAMSWMDRYNVVPEKNKYSQINCAKALGINIDTSKSHEAFYDTSVCYLIYKLVRDSFK